MPDAPSPGAAPGPGASGQARPGLPFVLDDGVHTIEVLTVDRAHQEMVARLLAARARDEQPEGWRGTAVLCGVGGRDVAVYESWESEAAHADALATGARERPESGLYRLRFVDTIDGTQKDLSLDEGVFTFINVFTIDPHKGEAMYEYAKRATLDVVREQPGYIATNFYFSDDGIHVANIGQYVTRKHFNAIFRVPRVLWAFTYPDRHRIVRTRFGFPVQPRLRRYEVLAVVTREGATRPAPEHSPSNAA